MCPGAASAGEKRFDAFIEDIALTPDELLAARHAARAVAAVLRLALTGQAEETPGEPSFADHLVIGGVGKRTAVRPLSAVDLLYLLPHDVPQDEALWRMESALRAALPSAPIGMGDGRLFIDQGGILVAVSPAVPRQEAYAIPSGAGWILCNPIAETAALRLSDSLSGGRTSKLLLLLKVWKGQCGVPISSFVLEMLVREFTAVVPAKGWAESLADFLAWARRHAPRALDLPGGTGRLAIDDGWHDAAEAAYWRVVLATRQAASGDEESALSGWRQLLGQRFGQGGGFNIWQVRPDLG